MLIKSSKLLIMIAMTAILILGIAGCGKSGNRFTNELPEIRITSYEGYDPGSDVYNVQDTLSFQQRIYWHAWDKDGTIVGYAYRILDADGNPMPTPGNEYFDDGSLTPQTVLQDHGAGWVYHYQLGADENISLGHPAAKKTIWTTKKYAVVNFPSADSNGLPSVTSSRFEVIAIDNRGGVTSIPAFRKFRTTSARPAAFISTTKGNPKGKDVGSGIRLSFSMDDFDQFLTPTPWYYEFKINKRQGVYVEPSSETALYNDALYPIISQTEWISTRDLSRIDQFLLTTMTDPALSYDYVDGVQVTHTEVVGRVYDLAGIVSDTLLYNVTVAPSHPNYGQVIGKTSIRFAVKPGFAPKTLIYQEKTWGLGNYHYVDYSEEGSDEVYPYTIVNGVQRFATQMFVDTTGTYTAVNSSNFKAWIRWGWRGEYGRPPATSSGATIYTDNPYDRKIDDAIDGVTGKNYYSEITHFDLRFNGQPYDRPPWAHQIITDPEGDWLRIPAHSPIGQTVVLTTLPTGTHTFEVRAVDLQGKVDPTPAKIVFKLYDYIPPAQRQGILIIDDDTHHATFSPDDIVQQKYEEALADYSGPKAFIKRSPAKNPIATVTDFKRRHLAMSDLQKFRLVIHHSDNPNSATSLPIDHDGLVLYMQNGGNFMMSGTHALSPIFDTMANAAQFTFLGLLGLSPSPGNASFVASAIQTNTFMQKAVGQTGYPNMYVQYQDEADLTNYPETGFNTIVNGRRGLSVVTYFNENMLTGDIIYKLGCKPVDYPVYAPSQTQFDLYDGKPVGIRKVNTNGSKAYIMGFPLSYMNVQGIKAMMNKVISEVM